MLSSDLWDSGKFPPRPSGASQGGSGSRPRGSPPAGSESQDGAGVGGDRSQVTIKKTSENMLE